MTAANENRPISEKLACMAAYAHAMATGRRTPIRLGDLTPGQRRDAEALMAAAARMSTASPPQLVPAPEPEPGSFAAVRAEALRRAEGQQHLRAEDFTADAAFEVASDR